MFARESVARCTNRRVTIRSLEIDSTLVLFTALIQAQANGKEE